MSHTFNRLKNPLRGILKVPGDKSISHRAVMLGSIVKGTTEITNFLDGEDCIRTIDIFRQFGVTIEQNGSKVTIDSKGYGLFKEPNEPLYFGNSGTTARLMLGLLSTLPFHTVMYGDPFLTVRPMDRVVNPLRKMGANIDGRKEGSYLPLALRGTKLNSIYYEIPVKSAQVKSALLLAGLFAEGETTIVEQGKTRDHTENMLAALGANITSQNNTITINPKGDLHPIPITVPGDISSAAFLIVASLIVPNSSITLKDVGLNETRTGIIDVIQQMGGHLTITNRKLSAGEDRGDLHIEYSDLEGVVIEGDIIPRLIDEIPIIALLATQAKGKTIIKDAEELRVKETDRIKAVVEVLTTLGAKVEETKDGMIITGKTRLHGGSIKSYSDHRMAMLGVVASFIASEPVTIDDISSIDISYPTFFTHIEQLIT